MSKDLEIFETDVIQTIDDTLENLVNELFNSSVSDLRNIFRYHLGLSEGKRGKRVRPVLTALCAESAGGDWKASLPSACAIELIHNFSLIHDDIEDNSQTRRGKTAVWKKWGLAKGINSGDAMFATAFDLLGKNSVLDEKTTLSCLVNLSQTCIALTEGQQLDIDFEDREKITKEDYFRMIEGKTAALISCCTQMGALIGGLNPDQQKKYASFGKHLGIAFQVLDDWLGIWGDPRLTGKSASSDLLEKKKSYPVVLGFQYSNRFTEKWLSGPVEEKEITELVALLEEDGIKDQVEREFHSWTETALNDLNSMDCQNESRTMLKEFADKLLIRKY